MIRLALAGTIVGVVLGVIVSLALPVRAPAPMYPDSIPPCSAFEETSHPVLAPGSVTDTCWYSEGDRVLLSNG